MRRRAGDREEGRTEGEMKRRVGEEVGRRKETAELRNSATLLLGNETLLTLPLSSNTSPPRPGEPPTTVITRSRLEAARRFLGRPYSKAIAALRERAT